MEQFILDNDINVLCVTASSFPAGVMAAHEQIHQLAPAGNGRRYFGLSRPEGNKGIVYKAAAELINGETAQPGLETFIIREGTYSSTIIHNYMSDIPAIGKAFQEILMNPDLDPNGICVEWYLNDNDMQCMVRLADSR